ncbi:GtrA family protein [Gordonia sp. HY002]|uniref:GtrA family protein n=1 Tax=Gordonia zhenghanii TaxID=2911516 RepID=UPI001EF0DC87|nr:GtrA family protein [Gordonia zhenghanii]MCF8572164.1 GtrA family protein [Gordonia zhenghanii]MCF8606366.1 GtrA family protein [Gordonia zhenghanii]
MNPSKWLVSVIPGRILPVVIAYAGFIRFALVGLFTFVLTTVLFFGLKVSVLDEKPVTAFSIATLVATIVSYVLNREWSFAERGGRSARHEASLFFVVSAIALGISQIPLAMSRYVFDFQAPAISPFAEHLADFVSGSIIGTLVAMAFRWWAFRKWVFPELVVDDDVVEQAEKEPLD